MGLAVEAAQLADTFLPCMPSKVGCWNYYNLRIPTHSCPTWPHSVPNTRSFMATCLRPLLHSALSSLAHSRAYTPTCPHALSRLAPLIATYPCPLVHTHHFLTHMPISPRGIHPKATLTTGFPISSSSMRICGNGSWGSATCGHFPSLRAKQVWMLEPL